MSKVKHDSREYWKGRYNELLDIHVKEIKNKTISYSLEYGRKLEDNNTTLRKRVKELEEKWATREAFEIIADNNLRYRKVLEEVKRKCTDARDMIDRGLKPNLHLLASDCKDIATVALKEKT